MEGRIDVRHLTKRYGKFVALDDVNLKFEGGKIYALLGRNGAGKTTLLHIINAHLFPNQGQVLVDGENPLENPQVLKKLCFIRESENFKPTLRVKEAHDPL